MNPSYPSPNFNKHQLSANLLPSVSLPLLHHLRYLEAKSIISFANILVYNSAITPTKTNSNALKSANI